MKNQIVKISKTLSYVLRHKPEHFNLVLDENGWTDVNILIEKLKAQIPEINFELLKLVVDTNDKKRFAFSEDFTKIRASQGHSIEIDLALSPVEPPEFLYHGTATRFVQSIREKGLIRQSRRHVHLSQDEKTAFAVATRHGVPSILTIKAGEMHRNGFHFYFSDNQVWLTDEVPVKFIQF